MTEWPFSIVDVFAEKKYAGNQLAVVRNAGAIPETEMQRIAREINFSETTFILSDEKRNGAYDVRIFTPASEIPFAGHPTLGTAFVIQKEILKEVTREVVLNFKAGRIPVSFAFGGEDADILWMKQLEPVFGKTFDPAEVAPLLNLDPGLIDTRFPVQEVSTGLFALIVPLKTLAAVKHSRTNREKLLDFISRSEARTVLLFSSQTYSPQNDLNVRVYADYLGVPEDPATGSANGCLAGYLVKHRYYGGDRINVRVEQGYEIGRPSLILLRAELSGGQIAVHVGGKVILVARGKLV